MMKCDFNSSLIKITLRHGFSHVNLLYILRTHFLRIAMESCFYIYSPGSFNQSAMQVRIRRRETTDLNPVSAEIYEDVLQESVCKVLSLIGVNVFPEDLHVCHRMKRTDSNNKA